MNDELVFEVYTGMSHVLNHFKDKKLAIFIDNNIVFYGHLINSSMDLIQIRDCDGNIFIRRDKIVSIRVIND